MPLDDLPSGLHYCHEQVFAVRLRQVASSIDGRKRPCSFLDNCVRHRVITSRFDRDRFYASQNSAMEAKTPVRLSEVATWPTCHHFDRPTIIHHYRKLGSAGLTWVRLFLREIGVVRLIQLRSRLAEQQVRGQQGQRNDDHPALNDHDTTAFRVLRTVGGNLQDPSSLNRPSRGRICSFVRRTLNSHRAPLRFPWQFVPYRQLKFTVVR